MRFQSATFTEELRRIFREDSDSETEEFEGFTQSDLDVNSNAEVTVILISVREAGCNIFSPGSELYGYL